MQSIFDTPYVPPTNINNLDEILTAEPSARALWAKVRPNLATMRGSFDQLAQNEQTRWQAIIALEADSTRTADYKAQQRTQIASQALQRIDAIKDAATEARGAALMALEAATQKARAAATTADAATAELQTQAAWARLKPVFDRSETVDARLLERIFQAAHDAVTQGDDATARALRREIGYYLEARGHVDPTFQQRLDMAIAPLIPAVERAAILIRQDIERGMARLAATVMIMQQVASKPGYPRPDTLPGWSDQEQLSLLP